MKSTALLLALALAGGGALQAQERQDRDRGPADTKTTDVIAGGEITSIDSATRVIAVRAMAIPGHAGKETVVEYKAKDRAELMKFKVGDKVVGKLSPKGQAPPMFAELKHDDKPSGPMTPAGKPSLRDSARTGGIGVDTTRMKPAPR